MARRIEPELQLVLSRSENAAEEVTIHAQSRDLVPPIRRAPPAMVGLVQDQHAASGSNRAQVDPSRAIFRHSRVAGRAGWQLNRVLDKHLHRQIDPCDIIARISTRHGATDEARAGQRVRNARPCPCPSVFLRPGDAGSAKTSRLRIVERSARVQSNIAIDETISVQRESIAVSLEPRRHKP